MWVRVPPPAPEFSALSFTVQGFFIAQRSVLQCSPGRTPGSHSQKKPCCCNPDGCKCWKLSQYRCAQPFLDFLQADAICVKQAGAAVTKVVETVFFQAVIFQRDFKMLGDKIGLHKLAHRIDIDVIKVLLAIGCSAHLLIDQLLLSEPVQQFLKGWDQRAACDSWISSWSGLSGS